MTKRSLVAALVVMLSAGSAHAILCKKKNGVLLLRSSACKAKEASVTAADIGAVGPQGPPGNQGPPGPAGPGAKWAIVSESGAIIAQSGGISVTAMLTGGVYLDFGTSLTGKVLEATAACTDTDCGASGMVNAARCGGGPGGLTCSAPGTNTDTHAFVFTLTPANTSNEGHPFFIAAF